MEVGGYGCGVVGGEQREGSIQDGGRISYILLEVEGEKMGL